MAEHPIIFSTEMVRRILTCAKCGKISLSFPCENCGSEDFCKTQTRRIIKSQPTFLDGGGLDKHWYWEITHDDYYECEGKNRLEFDLLEYSKPKYQVGDILWVREAWSFYGTGWSSDMPNQETIYVGYKADNSRRDIILPYDTEKCELCNGLKTPGKINPYGETTDREAYFDWQQKWWEKQKNKSARFMFRWAARIFLEITNIRVEQIQDIDAVEAEAEGMRRPKRLCPDRHDEYILERFQRLWDSLNAKRGYGWDKNPFVWVIEFKRI